MKALICTFAIALCFASIPLISADEPYVPSKSPLVRIDNLPKWLVDKVVGSKNPEISGLNFINLLHANFVLRVQQNENLTKADQEFLLSNANTYQQKYKRLDSILEDDTGLWRPKYVMMASLNLSIARDISKTLMPINMLYAGHPTIVWNMNAKLTQNTIDERDVPYAIVLHDALKYRMMPYTDSTIYRGMLCNPEIIKANVGKEVNADKFLSFSKNADWADFFMWYHKPTGDLQPCYVTMNLTKGDHCGFDIEDMSLQKSEYEVLVPYNTRIKVLDMTTAFNVKKNATFYKINYECLDKTKDIKSQPTKLVDN
jgi:hypothetical protein